MTTLGSDPVKYMFSEKEYEDYAAMYKNVVEELKTEKEDFSDSEPVWDDYDLVAYHKLQIDFEYLVELLQGFVDSLNPEKSDDTKEQEFKEKVNEIRDMISEFAKTNEKMGELLNSIIDGIERDREAYLGKDISVIVNDMRNKAVNEEILKFTEKWFLDFEEIRYEVLHYKDGKIENETNMKKKTYDMYKSHVDNPITKYKFYNIIVPEFRKLVENITPLLK